MVILPPDADDDQILAVVRAWVDLLADGEDEKAADLIRGEEPDRWTPQMLRDRINAYAADGPSPPQVTRLEGVRVGHIPPRSVVDRDAGHVRFRLPVNGTWSNLTANFRLVPHPPGRVLVFHDLDAG